MNFKFDITYLVYWENDAQGMKRIEKTFFVDDSVQDIVEYEFKRKYGKPFGITNYHLEPGAKDLVKGIESMWEKNSIDLLRYYHDLGFVSFFIEKHTKDYNGLIERDVCDMLESLYPNKMTYYSIEDSRGYICLEGQAGGY